MLPQLPAIPIQTSDASADIARNINRTFPVGQNVSATVIAVSRDQIQPEVFRLNLEVNNRLIQMGVFQPLPVGQTINVNRQSDGQIQITLPQASNTQKKEKPAQSPQTTPSPQQASKNVRQNNTETLLKIQLPSGAPSEKLPTDIPIKAAVISSRTVYPQTTPTTQTASTSSPAPTSPTIPAKAASTATPTVATNTPSASGRSESTPAGNTSVSTSQTNQITQTSSQVNPAPTQNTATSNQPANLLTNNTQTSNTTVTPNITNTTEAPTKQSASTVNTQTQPQPVNQRPTPQQTSSTINTASTSATPQNQNISSNTNTATQAPTARPLTTTQHVINLALPDGSKIEIISPRPLPQGTQVQFLKSDNGETHITRIQNPPLSPSSALERPGIQETLREALPRQIPTGDAFSQLAQSASRTDSPQLSQISSVVRSMLQLFGVQPGSQDAASQIRQNIELGGLNTERMLSKGMVQPNDLKSQLKQLQQLSEHLPNEQREKMELLLRGIHSRVTSQQLNSLQQWRELPDGGFERVLQLDLPIKQGDQWENLELRLSREGGTNSAGEMIAVWRIRLHFDLEDKGGLDAEIRLTDEHEISALFWCEQPETAAILKSRAEEFAERLRECGFSNSEVNWHKGSAPEQNQPIHKQLIDLHT